jgi:hypothetical protein
LVREPFVSGIPEVSGFDPTRAPDKKAPSVRREGLFFQNRAITMWV